MTQGETYTKIKIRVADRATHIERNVTLVSKGQTQKDGSSWLDFRRERPTSDQKETFCVNSKFIV